MNPIRVGNPVDDRAAFTMNDIDMNKFLNLDPSIQLVQSGEYFVGEPCENPEDEAQFNETTKKKVEDLS